MLVLTRKLHESILIGDDVSVTVIDIKPDGPKVRLGIISPKEVPVLRPDYHEDTLANSLLGRPPAPVRPDLVAQAVLGAVTESLRQPVADALARGSRPQHLPR